MSNKKLEEILMYDIIDNFISFVKGYFEEQNKKKRTRYGI